MNEQERSRKYTLFRGDCWQHLRNIIIDAMAQTGNDYIKTGLSDDLAEFSAFERRSSLTAAAQSARPFV